MLHKFKKDTQRYSDAIRKSSTVIPRPGELIRNADSFAFINVVLSVSEVQTNDGPVYNREYVWVRSVRYAYSDSNKFELLDGKRSRSFKFFVRPCGFNNWHLVKEYYWASSLSKSFYGELERLVNSNVDTDEITKDYIRSKIPKAVDKLARIFGTLIEYDNSKIIKKMLSDLDGVDTTWKSPIPALEHIE
jgi:hypothetical protein